MSNKIFLSSMPSPKSKHGIYKYLDSGATVSGLLDDNIIQLAREGKVKIPSPKPKEEEK